MRTAGALSRGRARRPLISSTQGLNRPGIRGPYPVALETSTARRPACQSATQTVESATATAHAPGLETLEETLDARVDLVTERGLRPELRSEVEREAIRVA